MKSIMIPSGACRERASALRRGVSHSLAASKQHTPAANEALDFFQVEDKNGKRRVKSKEFESRKFVLEALGGDPDRLERGEETLIKFNNNDGGLSRWAWTDGSVT